ncbi:MAG: ribonuclease P protein component [Candidatus Rokuibacteriota bacterium]|nr:MAG: ribonuclease P protein component [Candidatus Rokubacteria bacterium]
MAFALVCRHAPAGRFSSAGGRRAASACRPDRRRSGTPGGSGPRLRLTPMERRHRLTRSRDFEAVYRHGRAATTRYLVLYRFPREESDAEPRLGLAIPRGVGSAVARNRLKRRLRELWRARLEGIPAACDYVLVARQGLAEAAEARGFEWLGERLDEVLGKASA